MNNLPKIYVLTGLPSLGEIGKQTELIEKVECNACNKKNREHNPFSYAFASWNGQDLIEVAGIYYFVSERLKEKLEKITGDSINYLPIINEKTDYYKKGKKAYQDSIPLFYKLEIISKVDGPEIWWKRKDKCSSCGQDSWKITMEGIESTVTTSKVYNPRQVFSKEWNGEVIFKLNDPGLPIITQDFLDVVNEVCIDKISLRPAEWV